MLVMALTLSCTGGSSENTGLSTRSGEEMEAKLHMSSCAFILVNGHPLLAKMGKYSAAPNIEMSGVDSEMPR